MPPVDLRFKLKTIHHHIQYVKLHHTTYTNGPTWCSCLTISCYVSLRWLLCSLSWRDSWDTPSLQGSGCRTTMPGPVRYVRPGRIQLHAVANTSLVELQYMMQLEIHGLLQLDIYAMYLSLELTFRTKSYASCL